jgi:plasmid replication initiation protein
VEVPTEEIIDIYFRRYSSAHDNEIVQFVVRNATHDLVKGNALWMLMKKQKV